MGNISSKFRKRISRDVNSPNHQDLREQEQGAAEHAAELVKRGRRFGRRRSRKNMLSDQSIGESEYDPDAEVLDMQSLIRRIMTSSKLDTDRAKLRLRKKPSRADIQTVKFSDHPSDGQSGVQVGTTNEKSTIEGRDHYATPPLTSEDTSEVDGQSGQHLAYHVPNNSQVLLSKPDASSPPPPSPDLKPTRLPSLTSSVDSYQWRLSFSDTHPLRPDTASNPNSERPELIRHGVSTDDLTRSRGVGVDVYRLDGASTDPTECSYLNGVNTIATDLDCKLQDHSLKRSESVTAGTGIDSSQSSVHLYSMHISQHLRSRSALSVAASNQHQRARHRGNGMARSENILSLSGRQRHQRQTSSSGFQSAKVPLTWGQVLRDEASSIYSTQPDSPMKSPVGSIHNQDLEYAQGNATGLKPDKQTSESIPLTDMSTTQLLNRQHESPRGGLSGGSESPASFANKKKSGHTIRLSAFMSKSRSMHFGVTALKNYAKLMRSHSTEFDASSQRKHPVAKSTTGSNLNLSSTPSPKVSKKATSSDAVPENHPQSSRFKQDTQSPDARNLSQLYQDYVQIPDNKEPGGNPFSTEPVTARSVSAKSLPVNLGLSVKHSGHLGSRSVQSLRASTMDFGKLVEEIETKEKERIIHMAKGGSFE